MNGNGSGETRLMIFGSMMINLMMTGTTKKMEKKMTGGTMKSSGRI